MENLQTVLNTAFTSIKTDILATMATALPIALSVIGVGMAITFGVVFFKKLSDKGKN